MSENIYLYIKDLYMSENIYLYIKDQLYMPENKKYLRSGANSFYGS